MCSLFPLLICIRRDPQVQVDIVDALYDDGPFLKSLPNSLHKDGVMIAQVGEAARMKSPGEEFSWHKNRVKFIKTLISTGFESVRDYEEVSKYSRCYSKAERMQYLTSFF